MLNVFQVAAATGFCVNLVLGLLVLLVNPKHRTNRYFFITTIALSAWLAGLVLGSLSRDRALVLFWIRFAAVSAAMLPPAFDLLRHGIMTEKQDLRLMARELWPWPPLLACVVALFHMPSFVVDVDFGPDGFQQPVYGFGQTVYVGFYMISLGLLGWKYNRDLKRAEGIQKVELEFTVFAFGAAAFVGLCFAQIIPMLTGHREIMQLIPLSVILLDCLVAYGIATRRIMSVGEVLRRLTAYTLLIAYLCFLYVAVFTMVRAAFAWMVPEARLLPHIAATLAVALSMVPAQGYMQRLANRLFISRQGIDVRGMTRKAHQILVSIGTTEELLKRFSRVLMDATGTDHVSILLLENGTYKEVVPASDEPLTVSDDDGFVRMLKLHRDPLTVHALRRMRPDHLQQSALDRMEAGGVVACIGVHESDQLLAVVLLGRRLSGGIYGAADLDSLQLLCDQLGVALQNAKLYTEVQDGKIYNDILLDSLVSGIVAANVDQKVTVFNREAQRITGLDPEQVINKPVDVLPGPIGAALKNTIEMRTPLLDKDETITRDGEQSVPIRMSCAVFHSHKGEQLGALSIVNDMTLLKKLEEQVRRTDRLSSVGTLAAGMAHEIKNPLVSIKTFTQLLPEQYHDDEFRETFFSLVGNEVKRIDSLVNRLLKFSRPPKARLAPLHVHEVLDNSVKLVEQKMRQAGIVMNKALQSEEDLILGDPDLLGQAFINFLLNAIEAMDREGELTVATEQIQSRWYAARASSGQRDRRIRVSIKDTGCGISAEDIEQIFDPFFTTKSTGTGLGLSVAHGIIEEHGASIDVEHNDPKGSIFHLLFPIIEEKEAKA